MLSRWMASPTVRSHARKRGVNRGGPGTNGKRYCYLYRARYTQLPDTADYVFGERDPKTPRLDLR